MAEQAQIIAFQVRKRQAKIGVFAIHTALLWVRLYVALRFYIHNAPLEKRLSAFNFKDNSTDFRWLGSAEVGKTGLCNFEKEIEIDGQTMN